MSELPKLSATPPDFRLRPLPRWLEMLAGAVVLAIGVGLCLFSALFVLALILDAKPLDTASVVMSVTVVGLAVLMTTAGVRLSFNRANRYGSLLPPVVWYLLSAVFVLLTSYFTVIAVRDSNIEALRPIVFGFSFAALCYTAGRHFSKKRSKSAKEVVQIKL